MSNFYDVAIIGGGPTGSTVATLLAAKNFSVILFEKDKFPRFYIGESLNPRVLPILDKLGCSEIIEKQGYVIKHGAIADIDGEECNFHFSNGWIFDHRPVSYQVDRASFDKLLLDNAEKSGVVVKHSTQVTSTAFGLDSSRVTYKNTVTNKNSSCSARIIVDASGKTRFIAKQLRLHKNDSRLNNKAFYAHYKNVKREFPPHQGYIRISILNNGWLWLLPLANNIMSVGIVINSEQNMPKYNEDLSIFFDRILHSIPHISARFNDAKRVSDIYKTSKLSYDSIKYAGEGYILVGDAAFFLDPVFSTGVYTGMHTAELAASTIENALLENDVSENSFHNYQNDLKNLKVVLSSAVYCFYAGIRFPQIVKGFIKFWRFTKGRIFVFRMLQDFGAGFFIENKFLPKLLSLATFFFDGMYKIKMNIIKPSKDHN